MGKDTEIRQRETRVLHKEEAGVYVICSDEALLENINSLLKRKGVIGITDSAGRMHYMIDARDNKKNAPHQVNSLVVPDAGNILTSERAISEVFARHNIDTGLTGGPILFFIIRKLILEGETYHSNTKLIYANVCEVFNMSYETVERDVRYSINKSDFRKGIRSVAIIKILTDEVRQLISDLAGNNEE